MPIPLTAGLLGAGSLISGISGLLSNLNKRKSLKQQQSIQNRLLLEQQNALTNKESKRKDFQSKKSQFEQNYNSKINQLGLERQNALEDLKNKYYGNNNSKGKLTDYLEDINLLTQDPVMYQKLMQDKFEKSENAIESKAKRDKYESDLETQKAFGAPKRSNEDLMKQNALKDLYKEDLLNFGEKYSNQRDRAANIIKNKMIEEEQDILGNVKQKEQKYNKEYEDILSQALADQSLDEDSINSLLNLKEQNAVLDMFDASNKRELNDDLIFGGSNTLMGLTQGLSNILSSKEQESLYNKLLPEEAVLSSISLEDKKKKKKPTSVLDRFKNLYSNSPQYNFDKYNLSESK